MGGFANQFAVYGGWMGQQVIGYKNLDKLEDKMGERSIVVHKSDALDLPATMDVTVPVSFSPAEARHYDNMKGDLATQLSDGMLTTNNRLTQLLRLRQITCGYLPDSTGDVEVFGDSKIRATASLVKETLEQESRVVVSPTSRTRSGSWQRLWPSRARSPW